MFPRWYLILLGIWAVIVLPFLWFMAAFNGAAFTFFPDSPGPGSTVSLPEWIVFVAISLSPVWTAPFALLAWTRKRSAKK